MLSDNQIIVALATIVVLGVGAQWVGRLLGFPSLLLLLPAGLFAGDVTGLVEPEKLFGETLFPLVTLLVALLLFQSGLKLRFADLPEKARSPVHRLITVGLAITFVGGSLASLAILNIDTGLAFLLGAIISVSGPTVVGPLLSTVRAREPTSSVLNYEGTYLDPLGATLGVVVLNLVLAQHRGGVHPVLQTLGRLGLGVGVGLIAAAVLLFVMSRFLLTDDMQAAVALLFAVAAFAISDVLLSEAGLFATLTLGVALANQRFVSLSRVAGFGETLEVLIIGTLFILLGALVKIEALLEYAWQIILLVGALVLLVRPLTAAVSLLRTRLTWRERTLIGWVDPRGIVAASTAATFTGTLAAAHLGGAFLLPVVFGVIVGTGLVYGLSARPVALWLGLTRPPANGVGLIGDAAWVVELARRLRELGVSVLRISSSSPEEVHKEVDSSGVPTVSLGDTEARIVDAAQEANVGQAAVLAPSSTGMDLVSTALIEILGRRKVLRLAPGRQERAVARRIFEDETAYAFAPDVTLQDIDARVEAGAVVEVVKGPMAADALPLCAVSTEGKVNLQPGIRTPQSDDTVVALVGVGGDSSPGNDDPE